MSKILTNAMISMIVGVLCTGSGPTGTVSRGVPAGALSKGVSALNSAAALETGQGTAPVGRKGKYTDQFQYMTSASSALEAINSNEYVVRGHVHDVQGSKVALFDASSTNIQTVTPGKDGRFAFDPIPLTDEPTMYQIMVVPGNVKSVGYDKTVYSFYLSKTTTNFDKQVIKVEPLDGSEVRSFDFYNTTTEKTEVAQNATVFEYTGSEQTITIDQTGTYKLEVWGAAGGDSARATGGRGEYATGSVELTAGQKLTINVGGQGKTDSMIGDAAGSSKQLEGGFNGGGTAVLGGDEDSEGRAYSVGSGGGMSDFRLDGGVILSAGGGGGSYTTYYVGSDELVYDVIAQSGGDGAGTGNPTGGQGGQSGFGGEGSGAYFAEGVASTNTYYGVQEGNGRAAITYVPNREIHTVTFDSQGGSAVESLSVYAGDPLGALPNAYYEGKVFSGWFTAAEGGTRVRSSYVMPGNDLVLYAHYNENTGTVGKAGTYNMSGLVTGPADGEIQLYKLDDDGVTETMVEAVLPDENGKFTVSADIDLDALNKFVIRQKQGTIGISYDESYFTVTIEKAENGGLSVQNLKTDVEGNVSEVLAFEFVNQAAMKLKGVKLGATAQQNHVIRVKWVNDSASSRAESVTLHILAGGITSVNGVGADAVGNVDVKTIFDGTTYHPVDTDVEYYAIYKSNGEYVTDEKWLNDQGIINTDKHTYYVKDYYRNIVNKNGVTEEYVDENLEVFYQTDKDGNKMVAQFTDTSFDDTAIKAAIQKNTDAIEALDAQLGDGE